MDRPINYLSSLIFVPYYKRYKSYDQKRQTRIHVPKHDQEHPTVESTDGMNN
jgi:hypothetical protein